MIVNQNEAIELLKSGAVIGIPTDTVYGFAALEMYSDKIYQLKGRDKIKKLISMVGLSHEFAVSAEIKAHMEAVWPGQETIIFEENGELTSYRIPNEPNVIKMLEASGLVIKTTSANVSGEEPSLTKEEFQATFPEVPLLEEVVEIKKSRQPSKIYIYNQGIKKRIR